jgi:UDP-glucose 4-epimerase
MSVLVTGGAGYIGSHMTLELVDGGDQVVVLDNLVTGVRAQVSEKATFIQGDISDKDLVRDILQKHRIEAVIHFAGSVVVPDSVENPLMYYSNNTAKSRDLIESCIAGGVKQFIFSSTAAVYGVTDEASIAEDAVKDPASPYGRSKLMTEWMLEDAAHAHDFRYVALRYFNVAGADPKGRSGQSTPRATHLIKRACQVALGRAPYLGIYGTDFPTPDGTGVRDYIHVSDLIGAHALALAHLRDGGASSLFNCGYGRGFSVREVAKAVEKAAGAPLAVKEMPRRAGDPPAIVSNPAKLKAALGWKPQHDSLDEIVASALAWESRLNST